MRQIVMDILQPYAKYHAFAALRANLDKVFDGLKVDDTYERYYGSVWSRIDSIMNDTRYYKRGDSNELFNCNYHWAILPNRDYPERIEIVSITRKPVGTITIKNI